LPFAALQSAAFEGRPELGSLDRRVRAEELSVRSARGGYAPELVGSTSLTKAGRELDRTGWNWNAGVALNWPLVSGGQTVADTREAEARVESLRAERDDLRLRVSVEVEQARLDLIAVKAVLEAALEARASAESQLRLAEGRYTAGVGTILELGDAELTFTSAEAQRVQAEFELARARAVLLRALGRLD
jgi:outer membrane protein